MNRSAELRRKQRRVLAWSFGVAILLHGLAFVFWPGLRVDPQAGWSAPSLDHAAREATPTYVEVRFGHPEILLPTGSVLRVERDLNADHVLALPGECADLAKPQLLPAHGRIRVRISDSGEADVGRFLEGSGSDCGDAIITAVTDALRYEWLPSQEHPAPVDLVQPVTLLEPDRRARR